MTKFLKKTSKTFLVSIFKVENNLNCSEKYVNKQKMLNKSHSSKVVKSLWDTLYKMIKKKSEILTSSTLAVC